jgi:hypothetical protein
VLWQQYYFGFDVVISMTVLQPVLLQLCFCVGILFSCDIAVVYLQVMCLSVVWFIEVVQHKRCCSGGIILVLLVWYSVSL